MNAPPLYKYLPSKFANSLLEEGQILIGTLHGYRAIEVHGFEIGDQNEGILTEWSNDKEPKRASEANRLEREMIIAGDGLVLANNHVEVRRESPDFYIFCVSKSFSESIMKRMSADFDCCYDTCLEIVDPANFVQHLNGALKDTANFLGAYPCVYMERRQHYSANAPHPGIIKDPRYKYQAEVRFVWEPLTNMSIQPKLMTVPAIANCIIKRN